MRTKTLPLLIFFTFFLTIAFGQYNQLNQNRPNREMKAEVRAYVQKNIVPVMQEQRLKLEHQLSSQDKSQIRELRLHLAAARKKGEQMRETYRAQRQPGNRNLTEEQKIQIQNHRSEIHKIRMEARALAQQYSPQIQALYKEVAGKAQTWQQELAAIRRKHLPNTPAELEKEPIRKTRPPGFHHGILREYFRPATFLLWEVNQPLTNEFAGLESSNRLYPNPVTNKATLIYEVKEKGKVSIDLLNEQGKTIRNLLNKNQAPGQYSLEVNLSEVKSGLYFYKINSKSGTVTERFLKN